MKNDNTCRVFLELINTDEAILDAEIEESDAPGDDCREFFAEGWLDSPHQF